MKIPLGRATRINPSRFPRGGIAGRETNGRWSGRLADFRKSLSLADDEGDRGQVAESVSSVK